MKLWESMLAMLLCMGLIVAFGLTACGDDDDEADCAGALTRLQGGACEDAIIDGIVLLRPCLTACPDEDCEDLCWDAFDAGTSACEPAVSTLLDECGCQVCGNNFESCIVGGIDTPAVCVSNIVACFGDCVL